MQSEQFLDKKLPGADKTRISVMISKEIKYERLLHMEDNLNPLIVFRVRDSKAKWVNCVAFYRQWKDPRDGELTTIENINRVLVLNKFIYDFTKNCREYDEG